jgi:CO/xanthine dehydrogenase FAD-binding subunit
MALALDYSVVLRSQRGERTVPLDGFFEGRSRPG